MTQLYQCCVGTITKASAIGFTSFGCKQCHRNFEILPEQTEQHLTPMAILQETCDHDWEDWCKEQELNYLMIHPAANATKTKADVFKKRTGWIERTNEHARDAAMLVFKRFAKF